jgi:hypothetical protein
MTSNNNFLIVRCFIGISIRAKSAPQYYREIRAKSRRVLEQRPDDDSAQGAGNSAMFILYQL